MSENIKIKALFVIIGLVITSLPIHNTVAQLSTNAPTHTPAETLQIQQRCDFPKDMSINEYIESLPRSTDEMTEKQKEQFDCYTVVQMQILQQQFAQATQPQTQIKQDRYLTECGVILHAPPEQALQSMSAQYNYDFDSMPPLIQQQYTCINTILVQERANNVNSNLGDAYRNDLRNN